MKSSQTADSAQDRCSVDTQDAQPAANDVSLHQANLRRMRHLRFVFVMVGIVLAAGFIIGKYIDY